MINSGRKIIHVDMDAFFASIEQRDNPKLKGKAIAVGGKHRRGVVAAASYEARKFGVHSAMSSVLAQKKCPHLIFVKSNGKAYVEASKQIMQVFREYTDLVEPLSLDEAYLDVTENRMNIKSATIIAKQIKHKILAKTMLTASAGVSFNKFLAKVASDFDKPDGLTVVTPKEAQEFIDKLPVGKIPGVGKVTEQRLSKLGVNTGCDLKQLEKFVLQKKFGKHGLHLYNLVRCDVNNPVTPERIRKRVGAERTFMEDINNTGEMLEALKPIVEKVSERLRKKDTMGRTVTLKIKYYDFVALTRSRTLEHPVSGEYDIFNIAKDLLFIPVKPVKPVRLLGISVSNLDNLPGANISRQLSFDFTNY